MQYAQIKEGQDYAVRTSPRKGVKEEDLHTLQASRKRVIKKGVTRWAPTVKDHWGDIVGGYKEDGIEAARGDWITNTFDAPHTHKARDFLMPWAEYENRRKIDDDAEAMKAAERRRINEAYEEKKERVLQKLRNIDGLIMVEGYQSRTSATNLWHAREAGDEFEFSPEGVEFLLDRVSTMVYEILSSQDGNE